MENELTPSQSAGTTGNPQSETGNVGASDARSFQQSAGADVLRESRPLSVEQTGKPLNGKSVSTGSVALMWVFIVVASIVLILIASSVFKWIMKRPEVGEAKPDAPTKPEVLEVKAATKIAKPTAKRAIGKKKQSRSKRKK
jgi:hypothetical protein